MSRYRRSTTTGAILFFTVNTHRRRPVLLDDPVRNALRQAITDIRAQRPFVIHAWVLLPDHLHCIWELPEGDAAYGVRWSMIKRRVSQACDFLLEGIEQSESRLRRRDAGLWQRRFWEHQIRDEADLRRHVDYIHWNPVKHGLVTRVSDWPWSTFHRYLAQGVYPADWCHRDDGGFGGE